MLGLINEALFDDILFDVSISVNLFIPCVCRQCGCITFIFIFDCMFLLCHTNIVRFFFIIDRCFINYTTNPTFVVKRAFLLLSAVASQIFFVVPPVVYHSDFLLGIGDVLDNGEAAVTYFHTFLCL